MRVAITGCTGYIGSRVAAAVSRNAQVWAVVRRGSDAPLPDAIGRIEDTGTATVLADRFSELRIDHVLHLAADQSQGASPAESDLLVEANVAFTARLLSAAHATGANGVVIAGTFSQHASGTGDYDPNTVYAATKQAAHDMALYYHRKTPLRTLTLELADVYGPDDPRRKFLNLLAVAASSREPLDATPGEQRIAPLHVDDVVAAFERALHLLAEHAADIGDTYSVAGQEMLTVRELHGRFCSATGLAPQVNWGQRPYSEATIMEPYVGPALPGWTRSYTLDAGLAAVYGRNA